MLIQMFASPLKRIVNVIFENEGRNVKPNCMIWEIEGKVY